MSEEVLVEAEEEKQSKVKPKKEKLLNIGYVKMMILALTVGVCAKLLNTALPLYVQELGANKAIAGMVMGIYTIAALIMRPIYGNLADNKGRKIVLLIGISILTVSIFGLTLTTSVMVILILRVFMGAGYSGFSTAGGTVVSDVLPSSRLSEGIGYYGISFSLAMAIGPQIALVLIEAFGYNSVFIISGIVGILGILIVTTFNYEKKAKLALQAQEGYVEPEKEKTKFSIKTAFEKNAYAGAVTQFFMIMPMGFISTFIPTFGITKGIEGIGTYFTVYAIALLSTRLFIGKIADRYGASKAILPGMILVFIGIAVLAFSDSLTPILIAGGFFGFGYGCINPTMNAFIMKVCPINRRGAANATYYAALDGGFGTGSMVGGALVQLIGFQNTFFSLLGLVLIALGLFFKFLRKQILRYNIENNIG